MKRFLVKLPVRLICPSSIVAACATPLSGIVELNTSAEGLNCERKPYKDKR